MQDLNAHMEMMLFCIYGETARLEMSLKKVLETRGTAIANVHIFQRGQGQMLLSKILVDA